MERTRRRIRSTVFDNLSPEEQVANVIEHWEEVWTPFHAEIEYGPSIDDLEYCDDYYIPGLSEKIEGTPFDKYKDEIIAKCASLFLNN